MGRKSAKAQEDEEELKEREGGEFSLNSFRSPLQAEDVKSNCNLPGLQVFFYCMTVLIPQVINKRFLYTAGCGS